MEKRYRVVPPLEGVHPASSFLDRIYTEIPADEPAHSKAENAVLPRRAVRYHNNFWEDIA